MPHLPPAQPDPGRPPPPCPWCGDRGTRVTDVIGADPPVAAGGRAFVQWHVTAACGACGAAFRATRILSEGAGGGGPPGPAHPA